MANQQNLKPIASRTSSELREMTQKGGKASGEARREKKKLKELAQMILQGELPPDIAAAHGLPAGMNAGMAMLLAQLNKSLEGDTRAAEYVRDTAGEKPVTEVESKVDMGVSEADRKLLEKVQARMNESNR